MTYNEHSTGHFTGTLPPDFLDHLEQHLIEYAQPLNRTSNSLSIEWPAASLSLTLSSDGFTFAIHAASEAHLHQARESAMYLLDHISPGCTDTMSWTGKQARQGIPPNLHMARVLSARPFAANFIRIAVQTDGALALSTGGMHFSLLLPPAGHLPLWPVIDERGRTRWPEGVGAPHRAAYTFVTLDVDSGEIVFDVFLHEGGPTSDWARNVSAGDLVGLMGPGGGEFPIGDFIAMAGDETALPAIRRILEHSSADRRGVVLIELSDLADKAALDPACIPAGINLRWLHRGHDEPLGQALQNVELPVEGTSRFVWLAAEQTTVRTSKAWFRENRNLARTEGYFSAYWETKGDH